MGSVAITEKGAITIPSEIRRRYGLSEGDKLEFVESELGLVLVPIKPLKNLLRESFGIDGEVMREIAKEMEGERERERVHDESE